MQSRWSHDVGTQEAYESKPMHIARALRERILSGELEEGTGLKQRHIAQLFGVSPTPVREALSRLEAEGYVENRLHQGTFVRSIRDRVQENWRLRSHLEPLATQLAIPNLTDGDVEELQRMAQAFADAEPELAPQRNLEFHMFIYQRAHSPVLVRFITELWQTIDLEPTALRGHEESVREHAAIVDAIADRNSDRAVDLVRKHISGTTPQ